MAGALAALTLHLQQRADFWILIELILHSGKRIRPGRNVTTQAEADDPALGKVELVNAADRKFMQGVLDVNLDLAIGYADLLVHDASAVQGIGPDPITALHPEQSLPVLGGQSVRDPSFRNRIIGEIIISDPLSILSAMLGQYDSIRADEGGPFGFGSGTKMENEVTVHALEHSKIQVGNNCRFGFHSLLHGGEDVNSSPKEVTLLGNDVQVGSRAVVFRSTLGDRCSVGEGALVDGCLLVAGDSVPPRTIMIKNVVQGLVEW